MNDYVKCKNDYCFKQSLHNHDHSCLGYTFICEFCLDCLNYIKRSLCPERQCLKYNKKISFNWTYAFRNS